jgi:hypothetical protein
MAGERVRPALRECWDEYRGAGRARRRVDEQRRGGYVNGVTFVMARFGVPAAHPTGEYAPDPLRPSVLYVNLSPKWAYGPLFF